ncbi:MAG: AAA family ATPase, partial [Desulfobacterales bacterium]
MYKNFFGFNENPFKLVPNPVYLFLSKSHEEALAHLTYAVIQGEGFTEITGEVGTGKTTLCRAFLENLDHHTKAAYIFNPKLDSLQLLKAINDEFGIPSNADNIKDLIDTLNVFLIEQKTKGENTILLIDEAQNLTNEVLEQLRLLSNLETTRHKLLHIILVGQPELKEKLNSYELRQLGQRISLSCQLVPLNFKEVRQYIQHRIHIASEKTSIRFDPAAYRFIYKYSRGIPRLINIVCDRALLTAFGLDQQKITGDIVRTAIRELTGREDLIENNIWRRKKVILDPNDLG